MRILTVLAFVALAGCAAMKEGLKEGAGAAAEDRPPAVVYNPPNIQITLPPGQPPAPPATPGTWEYIGFALSSLAAYAAGSIVKGGIRSNLKKASGGKI